jgi:hypothetical protein
VSRALSIWATLLAISIVSTSIYGAYNYFSPIPFWDQWQGYIGFYHRVKGGNYSAWWDRHNEHRIVFSRILFWLDIVLFDGMNIFTVVCNFVLLGLLAFLLWGEQRRGSSIDLSSWLVGGVVVAFLFLWTQNENLKWGFQSQGFAVFLFGALAFAQMSREPTGNWKLIAAFACAGLATISMGNGIVVFPILAVQAMILRRRWMDVFACLAAGAVAAVAYYSDYSVPSPPTAPEAQMIGVTQAKYFLIFLGNPIYWIYNSIVLCAFFGVASLIIMVTATTIVFLKGQITPYRSFLIAIYGMCIASSLGTTHSRWMLGLNYAASSRYTTTVLISWTVISLLLLDLKVPKRTSFALVFGVLAVISVLARVQMQARGDNIAQTAWKFTVLATKIGLDHQDRDAQMFPAGMHEMFTDENKYAAAMNIGPFGRGWLQDAGIVKYDAALRDDQLCSGFIESVTKDSVGMVAQGWVVPHDYASTSTLIVLTNHADETVGYGVTGEARPDVRAQIPGASKHSGWIGFAKPDNPALNSYAYLGGKFCRVNAVAN